MICHDFIAALEKTFKDYPLGSSSSRTLEPNEKRKRVSLRAVSFYDGRCSNEASRSIFGDVLYKVDPGVIDNMLEFNDRAWMVFFRYPEASSSAVSRRGRKLMDTLKTFIPAPKEERAGQAWSIKNTLSGQEIAGIDVHSSASMLLLIY